MFHFQLDLRQHSEIEQGPALHRRPVNGFEYLFLTLVNLSEPLGFGSFQDLLGLPPSAAIAAFGPKWPIYVYKLTYSYMYNSISVLQSIRK